MSTLAPLPLQQPLVQRDENDPKSRPLFIDKQWAIWFQQSLIPPVEGTSTLIGSVALTGQTATIPTTPFPLPSLSGGTYEISWYLRVTTPAGVASSAQVTIGWTESGTAQSKTGALNNGNLATTVEVDQKYTVIADQESALTYAIAYTSNPAAAMAFRVTFTVKQVQNA